MMRKYQRKKHTPKEARLNNPKKRLVESIRKFHEYFHHLKEENFQMLKSDEKQ
jgi:hypothetical protein